MVNVYVNWLNWFYFLSLKGGLVVIFIDFSAAIPRCYKDVYVNSFFSCKARFWNSLLIECFPLTYDLNYCKFRINRHLITVCSFLDGLILLCFNLFLVTPCLLMAVQPCVKLIPINFFLFFNRFTAF